MTRSLPKSTQGAHSPGVKVTGAALLIFVGSLVLASLLWGSFESWPFLLVSELLAAVAGIALGWIFVRGMSGTQTASIRSSSNVEDVPAAGDTSSFALGGAFFAARAEPLRGMVDKLKSEADATKVKQDAGDTAAGKQPMFDEKILEPEYAIGQGLISREEFNDFRNTYLAQSELSLGLILPLLLIVFALVNPEKLDVQVRLWVVMSIVLATSFLFVIAMERRQMYRVELKLLLVSRWDKQAAANKAAKDTKAKANDMTQEDAIRKILKEELKGLHLEVKPLVVEVRQSSDKPDENEEQSAVKPEGDVF